MSDYTLSRSSWAYKFVFGEQKEWRLNGHPEPRNNRISFGLFIGLFMFMLIMRPVAFVMMTFLEVGIFLISFLVDGSYSRGKFPMELEIVKIEPWPKVFGYRFPPWILLMVGIVGSTLFYDGVWEGLEVAFYCVVIVLIFRTITPESKSPSVELAEAIEPVVDKKLRLSYYREPKLFPALHLVD